MYESIEKAAQEVATFSDGTEQKSNISISPCEEKIKDIRIQEIILENFRGIQRFRLSPQGRNVNIYGRNGAGKTTIADAWCWLLFGEDSHGAPDSGVGKFDVQTRGTSGLEYSVTASITCSGEPHTLKRVLKEQFTRKRGAAEATKTGYTTRYYIDEVPCKSKKEYEAFLDGILPDREIAKALTLPYVFPGAMKEDARREMLLKWFAPELDEDSILSRHPELAPLRKHKGYKSVEQYQQWAKEKRRAVNKELDAIPGRLDEAEKAKSTDIPQPGDEAKYAQLQNMKAKLTAQISGIRNGENILEARRRISQLEAQLAKGEAEYLRTIDHANDSLKEDIRLQADEISKKEIELSGLRRRSEDRQKFLADLRRDIEKQGQKWAARNTEAFGATAAVCPTCGRPLPEEQIQGAREAFNIQKSNDLEAILQAGNSLKQTYKEEKAKREDELIKLEELKTELERMRKKHDALRGSVISPPAYEDTDKGRELLQKIDAAKKEAAVLETCAEKKIPELQTKIEGLNEEISAMEYRRMNADINARQEARMKELMEQQKSLNLELASLDEGLMLAEKFIRLRASDLEESINEHFSLVRWKLYEEQINGGIRNRCEAMVLTDSGAYMEYGANLNDGHKVRGGLDIINAIQRATGYCLPVWVDAAGEITEDLHTPAQLTRLYATLEDTMALRCKYD